MFCFEAWREFFSSSLRSVFHQEHPKRSASKGVADAVLAVERSEWQSIGSMVLAPSSTPPMSPSLLLPLPAAAGGRRRGPFAQESNFLREELSFFMSALSQPDVDADSESTTYLRHVLPR